MKHISYIGSSLVFLSLAFAFFEAWLWADPLWKLIFAALVLGCTAAAIPALFVIKLHSMWVIDHREAPQIPAPRTRTRKAKTDE